MSFKQSEPAKGAPGFYTPVGTRRNFFQWAAAAGLIGIGLAIPLVGYLISPAFKRRERPWVEVGSTSDLQVGKPRQLDYVQGIQDGWMTSKVQKAVWAIKQSD